MKGNQFDDFDETPSFVVSRQNFFDSESGTTLEWTEKSPEDPSEDHDHSLCGCSRHVVTRPSGEPESRQNRISIVEKGSEFSFFPYPFLAFDNWGTAPHLYFSFRPGNNGVSLEFVLKEFEEERTPEEEPIFAGIYLGNEVDVSSFCNGHLPSRVVSLDSIPPDRIWMHRRMGSEAFSFLEKGEEAERWKRVIRLGKVVCKEVDPYHSDFVTPVSVLRERLEANENLRSSYRELRDICSDLYRFFPQSEVYRTYRSFSR